MTSNLKKCVHSWRFSWGKLNGIISRVNISTRRSFFVILFSVTTIMSNTLFVHLSRWSRSSTFLFKEHALIWNKARDLCLLGNFKVWIWSMLYYLELTTFSGSLFFSGEVLLNWLYRRTRSEGGFSESKLSLSLSLLVPCWERQRVCHGRDEILIC